MRSTIRCFLCVNALIFLLNIATLSAQSLLPEQEGQRARFSAYIEIRDAYLSGGCMLLNDGNLLKGAVGQAVQNMNLMFGIDQTTGLKLKASAF